MTQRKQGTSSQRLAELMEVGATLPYQDAPTGAVVASDAALEALRKTRPWAIGFAVLLFAYAAAGGAVGAGWLVILVYRLFAGPPPTRPFINVASINLLFAPI